VGEVSTCGLHECAHGGVMTWATIGDNMGGAQDSTEESAKDRGGRIMVGPGETNPMPVNDQI